MTNPQEGRGTGPGGERETAADTQETEIRLEAADAAARSGSPDAPVPDDAISSAAAEVGAGREDSVRGSGTNRDAPDTTEPDDDREATRTGDTDRWS